MSVAYVEKKKVVKLKVGNTIYVVDLVKLEQSNPSDNTLRKIDFKVVYVVKHFFFFLLLLT